jgi:uridine kinase
MWRQNVIKMHHEFVEPHKWNADFIIPWASSKENLVPIKAIGGALEYMIFSTTREWTKKTSKTKTI